MIKVDNKSLREIVKDRIEEIKSKRKDTNAIVYNLNLTKEQVLTEIEKIAEKYRSEVVTIDLADLDTSEITDMNSLFESVQCKDSTSETDIWEGIHVCKIIGLDNWDVSNVRSMRNMFHNHRLIGTLDLSNWDVSNVNNMENMFADSRFTSISDLAKWNTSNVENMTRMFNAAELATALNLSNWNVSSVKSISAMFAGSRILSIGDISGWDTSRVEFMYRLFDCCHLTNTGDLSTWNVSSIKGATRMFAYCRLTDVGDLTKWNVSKQLNAYDIFKDSRLQEVFEVTEDNKIVRITKDENNINEEFTEEQLSKLPDSIRNSGDEDLIRSVLVNLKRE